MSGVNLVMSLSDRGLVAGLKTAERAQDGLANSVKKTAAESRKLDAEMTRTAEAAKRLAMTPLERLSEKQTHLNMAVARGKISQDQANAALSVYRQRFMGAAGDAKQFTRNLRDTQSAGESAFGDEMLGKLSQFVSLTGALALGVRTAAAAWDHYRERANSALDTAKGMEAPNKGLSQLATSPEHYKKLLAQRDTLSVVYNQTREETTDTLFNANSASLNDRQLHASMMAGLIGDSSDTAMLQGKVKEIYGSQIKPEEAVNVALKASAKYPLNFRDFVEHMPSALNPSKELGLSFEETSAVTGQFSTQFGKPSVAFERYGNLMGKAAREERFKGRGMAGLEDLASMSDDDIHKMFGKDQQTDEAVRALRTTIAGAKRDIPEWVKARKETGTDKDALREQVRIRLSDPTQRAIFEAGQEEKRREVLRERHLAEGKAKGAGAVAAVEGDTEFTKRNFAQAAGASWGASGTEYFGGGPGEIRAAGASGSSVAKYYTDSVFGGGSMAGGMAAGGTAKPVETRSASDDPLLAEMRAIRRELEQQRGGGSVAPKKPAPNPKPARK